MPTLEVLQFDLNDATAVDEFLESNQRIQNESASQQRGYISRSTAISDAGEVLIIIHWERPEDVDASVAGFESAAAAGEFFAHINQETMTNKRYESRN